MLLPLLLLLLLLVLPALVAVTPVLVKVVSVSTSRSAAFIIVFVIVTVIAVSLFRYHSINRISVIWLSAEVLCVYSGIHVSFIHSTSKAAMSVQLLFGSLQASAPTPVM